MSVTIDLAPDDLAKIRELTAAASDRDAVRIAATEFLRLKRSQSPTKNVSNAPHASIRYPDDGTQLPVFEPPSDSPEITTEMVRNALTQDETPAGY